VASTASIAAAIAIVGALIAAAFLPGTRPRACGSARGRREVIEPAAA
jgi:hypothetical protein